MNLYRLILSPLAVATTMSVLSVAQAATLDRLYRMGDDAAEGAVTNGPVSATLDSAGAPDNVVNLSAVNAPTYRAIVGRPDGDSGRGIEFNAAEQEYLHGPSLNWPEQSFSSIENSGTLDYTGIDDRGMEFWVRPTSTAVQSLVMDSNQHGVRINANGRFSMRYATVDYESSVAVVPNTWYHVEVVRPAGPASGSRMYVNGIAVVVATPSNDYAADTSHLVVGANTAGDELSFEGGTAEFFSGIIDDLKMFVIGTSTSTPQVNYGGFNLATDNAYVASPIIGIKGIAGDVTNDGVLNQADKDAFIAGWMDRRLVNGIQIGDMVSRGQGDLNLDGVTDIHDLLVFQNALSGAGIGTITAADLQGAVPEPSMLLLMMTILMFLPRRRR